MPKVYATVGEAQGTASETEKDVAEARQGAEKQAHDAQMTAENGAFNAYHSIQTAAKDLWDFLSHPVDDVRYTIFGRAGDGTTSSQSSQAIVRPDELPASLLWITAASTGASLLLVWVVRRLLGLGAVPLLSRIAHSEIYENDARRHVSELVIAEPGLCLNDIVQRTGFSRNAVSYHLFVLEKEEEIVSVKDGKYRRYFTRNGKYVNGAKNVVAALRNETTLKLAQVVATRPGAIQRELCIELGATPSATCWHAKRLLDLGVIRKEKVSNTVKYFPGEALAKYDLGDFGLPRTQPAPVVV